MVKQAKLYSVNKSSENLKNQLPALMARVESHAVTELSQSFSKVFDRADDVLFEMADRAGTNSEQNTYFEAMREIRIRRRGLENGFRQALENNFHNIVSGSPRADESNPASNDSATSLGLSIMEHDDLEETVAIESMVTKLKNNVGTELYKLNVRFEALVSGIKVTDANNPLGPTRLVHGFTHMSQLLELDIKTKLILFKLFDAHVVTSTFEVLKHANSILSEAGILPQLKDFPQGEPAGVRPGSSAYLDPHNIDPHNIDSHNIDPYSNDADQSGGLAGAGNSHDPQSAIATSPHPSYATGPNLGVEPQILAPSSPAVGNNSKRDVFASLQGLLSNKRQQGGGDYSSEFSHVGAGDFDGAGSKDNGGAKTSGPVKAISSNNLLVMLSAIQNLLTQDWQHRDLDSSRLDVRKELDRILQRQQERYGPLKVRKNDDDVIDVVAMMFDVILEDENLSDGIKAMIGRLQIPLVKVAIVDKTFFNNSAHPARKLLNMLAGAGVGCVDEENQHRDKVYCKIQSVVQEILDQSNCTVELFEKLVTEFGLFIDREAKRTALVERRIIDAEEGKARTERARAQVEAAIDELMYGKEIPPVVAKLVRGAWCNVLFMVLLKEGKESEAWQANIATASDLIWSVQPGLSEESRSRLVSVVPRLLLEIREGLNQISYNPGEMSRLFSDLQAIHLYQLGNQLDLPEPGNAKPGNTIPGNAKQEEKFSSKSVAKKVRPQGKKSAISKTEANELLNSGARKNHKLDAPSDLTQTKSKGTTRLNPFSEKLAKGNQQKSIADITKEIIHKSLGGGESDKKQPAACNEKNINDSNIKPILKSSNDENVEPEQDYQQYYDELDKLVVGAWVEWSEQDGSKTRNKLAAKISAQNKYIFVNRAGVKTSERTRDQLAKDLKSGRIFIVDDTCLFDRALETVISNLRDCKQA